MEAVLPKLAGLMKHAPPADVDDYARRQLASKAFDWYNKKRGELATVAFRGDGQPFSTLYDLFHSRPRPETMDLMLFNFVKEENWDFNLPTSRITILQKGFGFIYHHQYHQFKNEAERWDESKFIQTKCMVRAWISAFFVPENIKTMQRDSVPPRLWSPPVVAPQELWDGVRARGVVPFAVKFLVYTKKRRHVYEVNLLRNTLLKDFRAGLFPVAGWAPRDVEIYPEFDKFHASLDIPEIPRKVMELAFESGRLTPAEVMNVFGMTLPVAVSNMDVLANRGILQLAEGSAPKRPDSGYMFNMKWFHSGGKVEAREMQAAPATAASIAKAAMQEGKEEKIAMRADRGEVRRGGAVGEDGRKVCSSCGTVMGFAAPVCPSCGRPA